MPQIQSIIAQPLTHSLFFTISSFTNILPTFLAIAVIIGLYQIIKFLWKFIHPFFFKRKNHFQIYGGGWAFITGASEGIGYGIAEELAKQKFNLILISRSEQKLQQAKMKLKQKYESIEIRTIAKDLQKLDSESEYKDLLQEVQDLDISILVNNVGASRPSKFSQKPYKEIKTEVRLNCIPMAVLTRFFIPKMIKRTARSAIINLSSGSTNGVFQGLAQYVSTKTFIEFLTVALQKQYGFRSKIDLMVAKPYYVSTSMTKNLYTPIYVSVEQCTKGIIDDLGRQLVSYGHWKHRFIGCLMTEILTPLKLTSFVMNLTTKDNDRLFYEKQRKLQKQK